MDKDARACNNWLEATSETMLCGHTGDEKRGNEENVAVWAEPASI